MVTNHGEAQTIPALLSQGECLFNQPCPVPHIHPKLYPWLVGLPGCKMTLLRLS